MPMTLKRYVDGQMVPLKLSILDAFLPSPRPRKQTATNLIPPQASTRTKPASNFTNSDRSAKNNENVVITKEGDDRAHTFSATDDALLIELKAAGKTWKEIVAEMGKNQSAVKERFKEIKSAPSNGTGAVAVNQGAEQKQGDGQSDAKPKTHDKKEAGSANKKEGKKSKKGKGTAGEEHKKANLLINPKPQQHQRPGPSTTENPGSLADIAARYERRKWAFAASKYFDLTGIRISKEEAKRRAELME